MTELRTLKSKLALDSLGKPSEPFILADNEFTRQGVARYLGEYRQWGEERRETRRKVFALQDEEAALSRLDVPSSTTAISMEITSHSFSKPDELVLLALRGSAMREYRQAVYDVQLEQWSAEADLLEERRQTLLSGSSTITGSSDDASAESDLAEGPWRLDRCVDGDTIEITVGRHRSKEKVRLLNINTPEVGQPGYYEATAALQSILRFQSIDLEFEQPGGPTRDRYGRVLAFVFVGDTLANYEMVKRGWGEFYTDYGRGRYALPLEFAEADARANRRGLHR